MNINLTLDEVLLINEALHNFKNNIDGYYFPDRYEETKNEINNLINKIEDNAYNG